ncbi:MAG TPA: hypothetical protein VGK30_09480, partial [Candidatus Binatia bacterium]
MIGTASSRTGDAPTSVVANPSASRKAFVYQLPWSEKSPSGSVRIVGGVRSTPIGAPPLGAREDAKNARHARAGRRAAGVVEREIDGRLERLAAGAEAASLREKRRDAGRRRERQVRGEAAVLAERGRRLGGTDVDRGCNAARIAAGVEEPDVAGRARGAERRLH